MITHFIDESLTGHLSNFVLVTDFIKNNHTFLTLEPDTAISRIPKYRTSSQALMQGICRIPRAKKIGKIGRGKVAMVSTQLVLSDMMKQTF
jgi:hypothetical protein